VACLRERLPRLRLGLFGSSQAAFDLIGALRERPLDSAAFGSLITRTERHITPLTEYK
jgi:hypothetical protein